MEQHHSYWSILVAFGRFPVSIDSKSANWVFGSTGAARLGRWFPSDYTEHVAKRLGFVELQQRIVRVNSAQQVSSCN